MYLYYIYWTVFEEPRTSSGTRGNSIDGATKQSIQVFTVNKTTFLSQLDINNIITHLKYIPSFCHNILSVKKKRKIFLYQSAPKQLKYHNCCNCDLKKIKIYGKQSQPSTFIKCVHQYGVTFLLLLIFCKLMCIHALISTITREEIYSFHAYHT